MRLVKSETYYCSGDNAADRTADGDGNGLAADTRSSNTTQSLPNIALSTPAAAGEAAKEEGYGDRYRYAADSYSSYDTDNSLGDEPEPDSGGIAGAVAEEEGEYNNFNHYSQLDENNSNAAGDADINNIIQSPVLLQDNAIVLNFEPAALRLPATKIIYNAEPEPVELPSRLVRGTTVRKERQQQKQVSASNEKHEEGQRQENEPQRQQFVLEEDEFNGLLAPGAFADEGQRAQADGGRLRRLMNLLAGGNRREREARLFKPTVFDPARKQRAGGAPGGDGGEAADGGEGDRSGKWLCCPARFCVAFTFVGILAGAVVGFFVWPRVPTLSVSSLTALQPARVIYDTKNNQFGLHMPMRITYEVHSGNFYPLRINSAHVLGFDGVTGNRIVDTRLSSLPAPPLKMQFYSQNAAVHYLTSDMADPALTDLFGKCAPRSSAVTGDHNRPAGRPGALTIRFQIRVDVSNLGWVGKQPIVTLNQNVECPE
ncbi:hypothetical protein LPJ72_004767 [Coemansia sp. Benny D160-2]|nr:hypothetical protein LPJ72_004767 [Coemansia sp. Benny D160-2]